MCFAGHTSAYTRKATKFSIQRHKAESAPFPVCTPLTSIFSRVLDIAPPMYAVWDNLKAWPWHTHLASRTALLAIWDSDSLAALLAWQLV